METIPLTNNIREHIFNSTVRIGFENGITDVIQEVTDMIHQLNIKHESIGKVFGRVPYKYEIKNDKLHRV